MVADLGDVASIERVVATVLERHGRLDIAINNAGVGVPPHRVVDYPEDDFDLVMRVNFKGVFYAVSAEVKAMTQNGGGAIVNNSSVGSLLGNQGCPRTRRPSAPSTASPSRRPWRTPRRGSG